MTDIRIEIRETFEKACELHRKEKQLAYESVMVIGRLQYLNAAVNLWMTDEEYFLKLGLTPDMYYKRCQAAAAILLFPKLGEMLKNGETYIAQLAMVSSKITEANSEIIIENLAGKSKRDLQMFLASIDKDGNPCDDEPTIEVKIRLTKLELELLSRARDILSSHGKNVSDKDAIVVSLGAIIETRDPMKKAERAEKRAAHKLPSRPDACHMPSAPGPKIERQQVFRESSAPGPIIEGQQLSQESSAPGPNTIRKSVPAAVTHQVWIRDQGQCTYVSQSEQRCGERRMIEIDHINPVARGGTNEITNLRLCCRRHNSWHADEIFGGAWMARKRKLPKNLSTTSASGGLPEFTRED
jgi:hypothetical protein